MLYFKCPTCKTILANKQLIFVNELNKICRNRDLDESQKNNAKKKLLDDLELDSPCCRMRMITFIETSSLIK